MKMACGLLAALALMLAACGGDEGDEERYTPQWTPGPTPDDPLAAAAARTTRVQPRPPAPARPSSPRPATTRDPVRVLGVGWSQPDIALPAGIYQCTATVTRNLFLNLSGELAPGVVVFGIYADGQFVRLIDGVRGESITRRQSVRVRGGVYPVSPDVEDGALWELECDPRTGAR